MYRQGTQEQFVAVHGGFVEVLPEKIIVAAEKAELPGEIDVDRALSAKERAEKRLKAATKEISLVRARTSLARAMARLSVAGKPESLG